MNGGVKENRHLLFLPYPSSLSGSSVSPGIGGREMKEEEIICNRWKELASG